MKALRTYKLKITSKHTKFKDISVNYRKSVNWLSEIVFKRSKPSTPNKLSREFYSTVRHKFHLPSQVTCSLFRHVVSTYRSMKSNKKWELAIYKKINVPLLKLNIFLVIILIIADFAFVKQEQKLLALALLLLNAS